MYLTVVCLSLSKTCLPHPKQWRSFWTIAGGCAGTQAPAPAAASWRAANARRRTRPPESWRVGVRQHEPPGQRLRRQPPPRSRHRRRRRVPGPPVPRPPRRLRRLVTIRDLLLLSIIMVTEKNTPIDYCTSLILRLTKLSLSTLGATFTCVIHDTIYDNVTFVNRVDF